MYVYGLFNKHHNIYRFIIEELEDTKGVIIIHMSKKIQQHNDQIKRKSTKGQTTIYKTYT